MLIDRNPLKCLNNHIFFLTHFLERSMPINFHVVNVYVTTQVNRGKNKLMNQINIRNEELLKQKDSNDILRTTLGKGEVEYNKRIDDIRLLKLEVKSLR